MRHHCSARATRTPGEGRLRAALTASFFVGLGPSDVGGVPAPACCVASVRPTTAKERNRLRSMNDLHSFQVGGGPGWVRPRSKCGKTSLYFSGRQTLPARGPHLGEALSPPCPSRHGG